ncbi:hypothetical protein SUGI_0452730 [Cryptomeria japonica]|uniref:uncharacterized protein LOC131078006 n=1 Tax=Cryptomeria japonica TaxID=3369 RepID=UPI002408B4E7|nr:uncharacterized protein LOC131078006 [Cryptomeria japonica]GLJ23834.1 hypothetical protein SUGI_0452730 [Cryptomeria japonica]
MTSLSQCLCGQSLLVSPPSGALRTTKFRNCNARLFGRVGLSSVRRQSTIRPLYPVSWWQEDGSATSKSSKQKWQLFCCLRGKSSDPTASSTNSENLSQESNNNDTTASHFILKQIQKLRKVDLAHAILGFSKRDEIWRVPWTKQTIFQVIFLWYSAFWLVGFWIIPMLAYATGFNKESLSYRGQALYSLVIDLVEGTVGMTILYRCLLRDHPFPYKFFNISWKGDWFINACLGCLMFPLTHQLQRLNLNLLPVSPSLTASSIVDQSKLVRDPIAMLLYAAVVSICAPIWEEIIFRGFLLPSLTRYMSIWSSIFVSAVAFALAHYSVQRFLPLTFLGLIMGIVFVRSRNLLASVLLHSLWNAFVFLELFV